MPELCMEILVSSSKSEFVNTIVKAGAGAGKTYGLIHKIVDLVREFTQQNNGELPRFVVTTFTRKATQEVRERLLAKALEIRKVDPIFGDLFLKFLRTSGLLLVSTIHGVLNQFLRAHGSLIGLDRQFQIVKSHDRLITDILHHQLENQSKMDDLVMAYGWSQIRFLFLSYHRASMFNPNILQLSKSSLESYWDNQIGTLQNLTNSLLPYVSQLALSKKTETLRKLADSLEALSSCLNAPSDRWSKLQALPSLQKQIPTRLGSLANWDESAKATREELMKTLKDISDNPWTDLQKIIDHQTFEKEVIELARDFSHQFIKKKIELGEIELEDLEFLSLYIIRNFSPQTEAFSKNWNYWFIDEYQDTSPIQVEILQRLINDCPHYVVGDPQQSIYFFRGARSKVFNEKIESFSQSMAKVEIKTINRRSMTPTLHFINDLMDVVNRHQFSAMDSIESNHSDQLLVGHFYLVTDEEKNRGQDVLKAIEKLLHSGVLPSDIAVLCRENNEIFELFKDLSESGVPVQIFSQGRFTEDREVRDALCLWHFLVNPFDNQNLIELLRSPGFLVRTELLLESSKHKDKELWNSLKGSNDPVIQRLQTALEQLNTIGHLEVWQKQILESKLFELCNHEDPTGRKEGNLWKLITHIQEHIHQGTLNYTDPLSLKVNTEEAGESEARSLRESNQVKLMTIHASKGLEFDHVLIPYLNHQRKKESAELLTTDLENSTWSLSLLEKDTGKKIPSYFSQQVAEDISRLLSEEDERLFYVAITRAKKTLHFFPPERSEDTSNTGWARHLTDFTSKGPGHYQSKTAGHYEFAAERSADLLRYDCSIAPETSQRERLPFIVSKEILKKRSVSITQLLRAAESTSSNTGNNRFDVSNIVKGTFTHKQMESFGSARTIDILPPELKLFISNSEIPFQRIIANGYVEWPFSLCDSDQVIEGQIDLWGRDDQNQIWIIDYKTGSPNFAAKAFEQMKLYAWCLLKMRLINENDSITLAVCYPFANRSLTESIKGSELASPSNKND